MSAPKETATRTKAIDIGMRLAEEIFAVRGGKARAFVSRKELAAMLALAVEMAAEQPEPAKVIPLVVVK